MKPFVPLLVAVLALGIADSMVGPYLVLFGADRAGLSPLQVGVFMSLVSISGLAVSTWLGRRYDRTASRWPAFLAVAMPALGYAAMTATTTYAVLLLIAVGLLGAGMAAFPQLFSLARTHLDHSGGDPGRRTPALRSVWSLAWAAGPLIGAALLAGGGYHRLLSVTALAFVAVALPLVLLGRTPQPRRPREGAPERAALTRPMLVAAGAFTFFHTAMLAGSVVLPLYVTRTLGRPDGDVGLLFSVCALVEIPAALAVMLLPARSPKRRIIVLAIVLMAGYFAWVSVSSTMPMLIGTQVARGVAIAVVGSLGITYVQDLAPHATGRATTLFANTLTTGALISGVLAGATAQALGYRAALLVCAALAAAGGLLLAWGRDRPAVPPPVEHRAAAAGRAG